MIDGDFVFYGDTDSAFLNYGKILKRLGIEISDSNMKQCVETSIKIDDIVKSIIDENLNNISTNVMMTPNMYKFESEEVISKMLIPSKKKYIAKIVYDKTTNQYPENELVVKGMEFKKSNLSDPIKAILLDITLKIMNGADQKSIVAILREKFDELPSLPIDDIAYAQGIRNIDSFKNNSRIKILDNSKAEVEFPLKCPYHVSGAIVMNALIDFDPRLSDMSKIREGDKGKIVFVTTKNMFDVKAITIASDSQFSPVLYEYFSLDVEYMFERLILGPLNPAMEAVGFKVNLDGILGFKFLDCENKYVQTLLF